MKLNLFLCRGTFANILLQVTALVAARSVHGAVFVVPEAALSAPAVNATSIVNFSEIAVGLPIQGQVIKGFRFSENNPNALIGPGPGDTNHISFPHVVSGGAFNSATYILTIDMPTAETSFGFGFAILSTVPTANALTISLFDGVNNLGSLTYPGAPDPNFSGGFAGIGSTIPFRRAQIRFGPSALAYAIDNVAAVAAPVIPEPGTALVGVVLTALCGTLRPPRRFGAFRR